MAIQHIEQSSELDCSPEATHELYHAALNIPRLSDVELAERRRVLKDAGYVSIGGIAVRNWETSVHTALSLHLKSLQHLQNGALIGPYEFRFDREVPGVSLYLYIPPTECD